MNLFINVAKNGVRTLYVHKKFRNEFGKSTTKVVERLGTFDELAKTHADPVAWAKEYIANLNLQEKEASRTVLLPYNPAKLIEKDSRVLLEGGYLFLQKLYYELRLDYICKKVAAKYEVQYDLNEILSTLIYGRILFPASKLGTFEYKDNLLEKPEYKLQDCYRALEIIAKEKEYIQSALYKFSKDLGARNDRVLYYDCTNYYFEIERESGMRKYGISKEHRPNPIVQMGLFLDGDGIPLAFCLNDGNTNEQTTLKPLEKTIIEDFRHSKFIVCTDAGLSSIANRKFNNVSGRAFITAQSIKQMKSFQREWALSSDGWQLENIKVTNGKAKYDLVDILSDEERIQTYKDAIFYKERWFNENGIEQRYIVTFSIKSMQYQRAVRDEQIRRAENALSKPESIDKTRQTDYKRFIVKCPVTKDGEAAERNVYRLNEQKIQTEEMYDGFYAVATNLEESADEIIRINRGRWEIEESFRIMKSEFKARPVFLCRDDRIMAHFVTCFLSLIIFRYLEKRLNAKYTCKEIIDGLKSMKFIAAAGEGFIPGYARTNFTDDIHTAFGFRTDYQIVPNAAMKKIFALTKTK